MYRGVSLQVRGILGEHTPIVEPLSLDEAYLDVSENLQGIATATRIAQAIRASTCERTGLTASAGVSYNTFLAKLASDHRKPDGPFVIPPEHGAAFVKTLEVGAFHGVGPVTAAKMNRLGIRTGLDLRAYSMAFLQEQFGKSGPYCYWIARGVEERPVRADRIRKSVGAENTFVQDLIPNALCHDRFDPSSCRDRSDAAWHGHEGVPGCAACLDDGVVVGEHAVGKLVLLKKKGNAAINGIKDLAGKKCGVQAGSAMPSALPELEEMLKATGGKMGEVVQYVFYPEAYQDLAIGRTDYVVNTRINLQSLVQDKPRVFELGQAVSKKICIAWAVKKGNAEVRDMLDTFLLGARKSGEMAKLQQKWFGLTFDMPEHWAAS